MPRNLSIFRPTYSPSTGPENPVVQSTIAALNLTPHIEGGYFAVTDADPASIQSPYPQTDLSDATVDAMGGPREGFDPTRRLLSTTIFYYLTPSRPRGTFHANRSRIIHTLHRGRGRYVLLHPAEEGGVRVETFVVGQNVDAGERLQWVVQGGVYKASFLLDERGAAQNGGLLISETVVPGFEYADHEFLSPGRFQELLTTSPDVAAAINWLVNKEMRATVDAAAAADDDDDEEWDSASTAAPQGADSWARESSDEEKRG